LLVPAAGAAEGFLLLEFFKSFFKYVILFLIVAPLRRSSVLPPLRAFAQLVARAVILGGFTPLPGIVTWSVHLDITLLDFGLTVS
jgi:hypothetical protein